MTPLMTPEQVSKLLGVTLATLKDWRYRGRGPSFVKLNRMVRYEAEAVEAYVAEMRERSR